MSRRWELREVGARAWTGTSDGLLNGREGVGVGRRILGVSAAGDCDVVFEFSFSFSSSSF